MDFNISKTIIDDKGKIIFFGLQHFLNDIAKGDCCFICGAKANSKDFNDEHIIPDWILRKYNLHKKQITLPNGSKIKYGSYKVPCCKECNSELGETYELPISNLLNKSYSEIIQEINNDPGIIYLLFKWLCLIFLKTHLKDKALVSERDKRIPSGFLADEYFWEDIHHIHCIARSYFTNAIIDYKVYGTIFILPVLTHPDLDNFDYIDSPNGKGVLLQLGEFLIISVLNDSCAGYSMLKKQFDKITGPLTPFQAIEIFSHLNFLNLSLKDGPTYYSTYSKKGEYHIRASVPKKIQLLEEDEQFVTPGNFLRYYLEGRLGEIENKERFMDEIESGKLAYLFDENGVFISHSNLD